MSKAMQLVGIILLGIFTLVIIYLMSDVRSTNELDYYLLQEVTEASMYDAVDYSYYRETGLLKVDRDMFLESFNRRFAESVSNDRDYTIKIIDFNETPPKVSIEVSAPTVASVKGEVAIVTNRVSGILETIYDDFVYAKGGYGLDSVDTEKPKIDSPVSLGNNKYSIRMTDNEMLAKYAIVELEDGATVKVSSISNWKSTGYVTEKTVEETLEKANGNYWIVVLDRSGNAATRSIIDRPPTLTYGPNKKEENYILTLKDDYGLSFYTIQKVDCAGATTADSSGSYECSSGWQGLSGTDTIGVPTSEVKNSDDGQVYANMVFPYSSNPGYYSIYVTDNTGHRSKQYVIKISKHEINIDVLETTSTTAKIKISDTHLDLESYQVSCSDSPSVNGNWQPLTLGNSNTITVNAPSECSDNYYIYAKDNSGKTAKANITFSRTETILDNDVSFSRSKHCYFENGEQRCPFNDSSQTGSIPAISCLKYKQIVVTIKFNSLNTNDTICRGCVCNLYPTLVLSNNSQFSVSHNLATYIKAECDGYGPSRYADGLFSCGQNSTKTECSGNSNKLITNVEKQITFDINSCPTDSNVNFSFGVNGGNIGYSATITKIEGITR